MTCLLVAGLQKLITKRVEHEFPCQRNRPLSLVGNYKMNEKFEPITVTVAQIRELTGLSTSSIYRMFESGKLPRKKLGGKTLVLMSDLRSYLESELKAA